MSLNNMDLSYLDIKIKTNNKVPGKFNHGLLSHGRFCNHITSDI